MCSLLYKIIAFALCCSSDVEEGGETVFPNAKGNVSAVPWWDELSECGKGGLSVKPKMGDALLFWSMKPDATLDEHSLHGKLKLYVLTSQMLPFVKKLCDE